MFPEQMKGRIEVEAMGPHKLVRGKWGREASFVVESTVHGTRCRSLMHFTSSCTLRDRIANDPNQIIVNLFPDLG